MLVDSHCHLNFPDFKDDVDLVVKKAKSKGVCTFLTINTRLSEIKDIQQLTKKDPAIFCSVGVHPHEAKEHLQNDPLGENLKKQLQDSLHHPKTIGIGETGLDFYYYNSPKEAQEIVFQRHIEVAKESHLPLIVHTRDAEEETINLLQFHGQGKVRGVIHCFSGSYNLAKHALDLGFYISVSGIITFKKAELLQEVIKKLPLEKLLVETDAPYLAPTPYRGKRNEPSYVIQIAQILSDILNVSFKEVQQVTTNNFFTLFSKAMTN